jgi:hypothetical protein
MDVLRNDEPRRETVRHQQKLATIENKLFSFLSNITGSVFWWSEQKRWRLADQIEQRRWAISDKLEELEAARR